MNLVVTAACFLAAVLTTLFRGAGSALAFVYLPALLLLSRVASISLPALPDPNPPIACIYGILIGGLVGGRWPRLRLSPIDYIVVSLLVAYILSAVRTEYLYTGVSVFGSMALSLVVPYFIVRCTFEQKRTQRETLFMLVAVIPIVAFFALIEFRLWPHFYLLQLQGLGLDIGLADIGEAFAYRRFGFFRAEVSFAHPIDLGLSAALVLAAIFILAKRARVGTRNLWVRVGLGMALAASLASGSFTTLLGLAAGLGLYLLLLTVPFARRFLVPGVAIVITLGFAYVVHVAGTPLPEGPIDGSAFEGSRWIRHLIIQRSWQAAATAGAFGWGRGIDLGEMVDLRSLDNAYLLIVIERGWVALGLWLAVPLCLAAMVWRTLRRVKSRDMVRSILAGFCASIGTMIALFTVYLGDAYSSLLMVMIALTANATQAAAPAGRGRGRSGFSPPAASHGSGSSGR